MNFSEIFKDKRIVSKLVTIALVVIMIFVMSIIYDMLSEETYVNAVDNVGPKIVRVTSSNADGSYTINQKIYITLEFNEEIVMKGENAPRLILQLDGKTRYAEYVDDGSKSTMTFKYSVVKGDNVSRLNYVAEDSIDTRGVIITDRYGNESSLLMPLPTSENSLKGTRSITINTNDPYPIITVEPLTEEINKYTIVFDKVVAGFDISDISVYDGNKDIFTEVIPGKKYELSVSKTGVNKQSIMINAGVCYDAESKIPNSNAIIIPSGFYYAGGTKNSGIVITDNRYEGKQTFYTNNVIDERVVNLHNGNTYVWIPIDYINDQTGVVSGYEKVLEGRFGKRQYMCNAEDSIYKESVSSALIASVEKYKGFFVARYEGVYSGKDALLLSRPSIRNEVGFIGRNGTNDRESSGVLYNYLTASTASSAINKLYGSSSSVVAHLPYAAEYDTVLKWFEQEGVNVSSDSSNWGNYYNSNITSLKEANVKTILNTGQTEETCVKNIYDLAGNLWEWTQERAGSQVARGGCYSSYGQTFPAAYKKLMDTDSLEICGARAFLYIK